MKVNGERIWDVSTFLFKIIRMDEACTIKSNRQTIEVYRNAQGKYYLFYYNHTTDAFRDKLRKVLTFS